MENTHRFTQNWTDQNGSHSTEHSQRDYSGKLWNGGEEAEVGPHGCADYDRCISCSSTAPKRREPATRWKTYRCNRLAEGRLFKVKVG